MISIACRFIRIDYVTLMHLCEFIYTVDLNCRRIKDCLVNLPIFLLRLFTFMLIMFISSQGDDL